MDPKAKQEFESFQKLLDGLSKAFSDYGYEQTKASELAFFVAQGIRDVPELIRLVMSPTERDSEQIIQAVIDVLANLPNLEEAAKCLLPRSHPNQRWSTCTAPLTDTNS